jgi:RNA polymerase sigma-70 factor (ECF subfamily)
MDESQFARALAQHRALMLRRAQALVGNKPDAEDVVQEALERAWRSRERFMPDGKAAPWLLKIAQNAAFDLLRRRNTAPSAVTHETATRKGPDDEVLQRESAQSIARAIRDLAPPQRRAFLLHDLHGYSNREISMHVQLPYHTVRTHLFRARQHLRSALRGAES